MSNSLEIFEYGRQIDNRNDYIQSTQICAPFQHVADCDNVIDSKGNQTQDPTVDWQICCAHFCPAKRKCRRLNKSLCYLDPDNKSGALIRMEWEDPSTLTYRCTYDASKITTMSQINLYRNKYMTKNVVYSENLKSIYRDKCAQLINQGCPAELGKECSVLFSNTADGAGCRQWINHDSTSMADRDSVKERFCTANPGRPECACIDRAKDPNYHNLTGAAALASFPYGDDCWYTPCKSARFTLKTSNVSKGSCPSNICQILYNFAKIKKNVNFKDVVNTVSCHFDNGPVREKHPDENNLPKPPDSGGVLYQNVSTTQLAIIGSVIILLVVILIYFF